ncbi:uncharacterized protein MYCGRDRAFT_104222 [Zymoseptoria tritici IPO323]|nr:uncharacterized protein MYCGRDRAFT_104222 [Zymoseptoria tritici IPO323]EGP88037.1 hypothetical protein MYCGRDRAFT_104222 [Zymoseptoria tritici IPO323]
MRKNAAVYAQDMKAREAEDASLNRSTNAPSVKARKFGRSVVNLLRTKSGHNSDGSRSPIPASPMPPDLSRQQRLNVPRHMNTGLSAKSSLDSLQTPAILREMGMGV